MPPEVLARMAARRRRARQVAALAGFAYAVLVLIMWGPFSMHSGFPFETGFPYLSESTSALKGFLYASDPLRIHLTTFYHLPYLIGEALGIRGSYVPYQVVYALLWWARGFLVFLVLRKFLPGSLSVCYAAGALVVLHTSDGAVGWVGQIHQPGLIFWMVLAFYLLTLAAESANWARAALFVVAAGLCEYMSLWTYESQLPLMLVLPLGLLFRWRSWRKLALICGAWYSIPAIYIRLTVLRYLNHPGHTYQESVVRKGWSWPSLLADWLFNIGASLKFWNWPHDEWIAPKSEAYLLALIAALVFFGGGLALMRLTQESRRPNPFVESMRTWWILLGVGLIWVVLSFPAYLLLDSARGLWRTQFLSGIGAGLVLAAVCGLTSQAFVSRTAKLGLFLGFGAVIAFFGSTSAIQKCAIHRSVWERHRAAMEKILRVAPSVAPFTLVVVTNVPKDKDPFGHDMWLDLALRLAYPGIPVAGTYFYSDGTPAPGDSWKAEGKSWTWDGTGISPVFTGTGLANTLVVDYQPSGRGKLEAALPAFLCKTRCATELYHPDAVVTEPISPVARRRYRLD